MVFKKEDFDFLEIYVTGTDTKVAQNDKIQIIADKKEQTVRFAQISNNIWFITKMEKVVDEDFTMIINVKQFYDLVKQSGGDITLKKDGLYFASGEYKLEQSDYAYDDIDYVYNIATTKKADSVFTLSEISKASAISSFIGGEDPLATVVLQNGHFVTSNRYDVTAVAKTESNDKEVLKYLSSTTANILMSQKIEEVDIHTYKEENFYTFKINSTLIVVNELEYLIPDLFSGGTFEKIMHPSVLQCDKADLKLALSRMKILASKNFEGRLYLKFAADNLILENRTGALCKEEIKATVPKELFDREIILSVNWLSDIINKIDGSTIDIMVGDEDASTATLKDSSDEKIFIHCLYA